MTNRDVVASLSSAPSLNTHSELLEGEGEAAAVADVPHHGGLATGEGGEVAGGAVVQSGDAAGDIHLRQGLRTSGCDYEQYQHQY